MNSKNAEIREMQTKEMKFVKLYLIILYQIAFHFVIICSDHVQVMHCSEEPKCLENLYSQLLEILEENISNRSRPCEHFWHYACGSWTSAPYYDHLDNFGAMANYYADNLIQTLHQLHTATSSNISELVDQLMKYFSSCRSVNNHDLNMSLYLKEIPAEKLFGKNFRWSHALAKDKVIWQNFNWLRAVAHLRQYGFKELFIQESVSLSWSDSPRHVLQLQIPNPKNHFVNKYQILQIMADFDLIFDHNNATYYIKLADELLEFDKKLLELLRTNENAKQTHYISLQELLHLANSIDWSLYLALLLNQTPAAETLIELSGNFKYFQSLTALLEETPKNIQAAYILIRFCKYLLGIRPLTTDRECLLHTNVMFPLGTDYIYNKFLYKNRLEDEEKLHNIFSMLKHEFSKNLLANKFSLSHQEIQYLEEKLRRMKLKIGNLPLIINNINYYYAMVQLYEDNFYHNHLEMLKFRTWQQHSALLDSELKPFSLDADYINDDISQLRTAPYFIHQRNMLIVPMIFLQLPFYHYAQPTVLQFSLVGWIMAHELSHGFDTHGLQFDAFGKSNSLGIQISRNAAYLAAVECLVKHSPTVSLNERIADVNGLQLAWQTFAHQITNNNGKFLNDFVGKIFFINFAQFFCGSLPLAIGHDRDDVRVRDSVGNMREFAEVFNCPKWSKENPTEKCNIWRT